jgi:hypothetical protein
LTTLSACGNEVTRSLVRVRNVIRISKLLANNAAKTAVNKPRTTPVPVLIFISAGCDFLYRKIEIPEATGASRQHAIPSRPGIVLRTAAPNPQTRAGKYFLLIPFNGFN